MSKKNKILISFVLLIAVMFNSLAFKDTVSANDSRIQSIKNPFHEFTITFNEDVRNTSSNLNEIYIQSENNNRLELFNSLSSNSKKVIAKSQNPYIYGETYTLVVPAGIESAKGGKTKKQVNHKFKVEGNYIDSIVANHTSLLTNINVKTDHSIQRVTVTLENGTKMTLNSKYYPTFSRGVIGLLPGDLIVIDAYNSSNNLVETQYVKVR